jgi:hypothetical protein
MTAIAPTVAEWLGLTLAPEAGEGLEVWGAAPASAADGALIP